MKIYLLNFKRTGVESVSEALQLQSILAGVKYEEIKIDDFFGEIMYATIKEVEFLNSSGSGGGLLMAINYPLLQDKEKKFAKMFLKTAMESKENLYYYPKPNRYVEVDDFAFFSLVDNITSENLKIESLYRQGKIRRDLRGKLHTLLRKDKKIDEIYINKIFFYESRKLFNCSWKWKEYQVTQEQLEFDLLEKISVFYEYPQSLSLSTINFCNLACKMCIQFDKNLKKRIKTNFYEHKQYLEEEIVYQCIDFIAKGRGTLEFCATGETLLDNRLVKFVKYANQSKIKWIGAITNGILLESKGEKLLEAGLNRMTISIDGATPEIYKRIRGADLNQVERGVRKCVEYARKLNVQGREIEFGLNCVLVDEEVESQKDLYLAKWKDCRDIITRIHFINKVEYDTNGSVSNAKQIKGNPKFVCQFPWTNLIISCYGDVVTCCTMNATALWNPINVGNLHHSAINEIWNHHLRILRESLLSSKTSKFSALCRTCVFEKFMKVRDCEQTSVRSQLA